MNQGRRSRFVSNLFLCVFLSGQGSSIQFDSRLSLCAFGFVRLPMTPSPCRPGVFVALAAIIVISVSVTTTATDVVYDAEGSEEMEMEIEFEEHRELDGGSLSEDDAAYEAMMRAVHDVRDAGRLDSVGWIGLD